MIEVCSNKEVEKTWQSGVDRRLQPEAGNFLSQDIAIFMFKIRNRLLPYNILELFSSSPSNYNLRNSDFHVQRVKTVKYGKHSLRFFGPFLWSKLSMKDRNETSLSRFKANIRRKDLSKLVSDNACKGCHLCDS